MLCLLRGFVSIWSIHFTCEIKPINEFTMCRAPFRGQRAKVQGCTIRSYLKCRPLAAKGCCGYQIPRSIHYIVLLMELYMLYVQQGKSEGFESCDWPIVRKRPIWVNFGDVLYRVTLKFEGWPWKTIGHLSFAVSSFVQHFIAIGEFKLELQTGNAHFGSNSTIFRAVWPWNLTDDLEKQ